jgi:ATP-dependent RNA helicase DDX55/SPB4
MFIKLSKNFGLFFLRELYDKGKEAFVSYIRAYSKHECSYLLRVKEIDFSKLSLGFGLLHLPKMPEIKKSVKYENFKIDFSSIPYK